MKVSGTKASATVTECSLSVTETISRVTGFVINVKVREVTSITLKTSSSSVNG